MTKDKEYWDSKHPKAAQTYMGRPLPNGKRYSLDVRHFIWDKDVDLTQTIIDYGLKAESNDEAATRVQNFVVDRLKYVSDKTLGASEYWLFPSETMAMRQGDCEDGAILMATLLTMVLPPEHRWRVRVAAGWVQSAPTAPQGGHAYVGYCRCRDNEWVILDWCYYQDANVHVKDKPLAKEVGYYKDVWFSFNHEHAWSHIDFAMNGRVNNVDL